MQISYLCEDTLLLQFVDQHHDPLTLAAKLQTLANYCQQHYPLQNHIISFDSLMLRFHNSTAANYAYQQLPRLDLPSQPQTTGKLWQIPVCYHPSVACDLIEVARLTKLAPDEVVARHQATRYRIYAIGFSPGFAYCGYLDERLLLPRKAQIRTQVPAGSLAIAERQSAIYPSNTPGGWWLIGRTPCVWLLAHQQQLWQPKVGDEVQYQPISLEQYHAQSD